MEYITNILDIVKFEHGLVNIIDDQIIIECKDVKLTHIVKSKEIQVLSTDFLSFHILRLIASKLKIKYDEWMLSAINIPKLMVCDYFFSLKEIFDSNFYDHCTICGNKHDKLGLNYITTCANPTCVVKCYHYPTNNKITEINKHDQNTMILLFRTLLSALTHPKVDKILSSIPKIHSIKNVKELISCIPKKLLENQIDEIITVIEDSYDDFYLWTKLDNNLIYALLLNAVSDNYYSMYSYRDLVNTELKKRNTSAEDDVEYYNISYSTEIENDIKSKLDSGKKYYYLYHGSPFHCWYSIIKNGLKVMSGTEFMTTGAAFGNGIYLSDFLATSHGYARPTAPFNYAMIGLFQVIENPEKYLKTTGIYVVPTEKILILRTLIKINKIGNPRSSLTYTNIDNYFIRQRTLDKSISDKNLVVLKNKRLSAELKFIEKCADKFKVIYYSDEEKTPWEVEIYIRDAIYKIEVYFHNYPLSPPMLKMKDFTLYPKGIIDSKLIINLPVLNPGTWSISNKLVEVLDTIWHFFLSSY
jgi:ubiquitin-protein ligase